MAEEEKDSKNAAKDEVKKERKNQAKEDVEKKKAGGPATEYLKSISEAQQVAIGQRITQVNKLDDVVKALEANTAATNNAAPTPEEEEEKKAGFMNFLTGLKDTLKGAFGKDKDAKDGGIMSGIKKMFSFLKIKFLAIGALVVGLISQMNLEDLEKLWEAFKKAWDGLKKFMTPIIEHFKKTVFPKTIELFINTFTHLGTLFEDLTKDFEGFSDADWMGKDGKFHKIINAFESIGKWALNMGTELMNWGWNVLGGEGKLSEKIKNKYNEWFGEDSEDGFMSKIGSIVKTFIGMFAVAKLMPGTWATKMLTTPLRLALRGAFGLGKGVVGGLANLASKAIKGVSLSGMGPGLLGTAAKATGIIGLAYAVGKGAYAAYEEYEKGGNISQVWTAGISEFMQVMSLGLLDKKTADKWSKGVVDFFGDVYDFWFGDKKEELTEEQKKQKRIEGTGADINKLSQEEKNQLQKDKIVQEEKKLRGGAASAVAKGDITGIESEMTAIENEMAGKEQKGGQYWTDPEYVKLGNKLAKLRQDKLAIMKANEKKASSLKPVSEAGQIMKDEGFRAGVYKDTKDIDTIGYGFNLERKDAQKQLDAKGIKKSVADLRSGKAQLTEEEASRLMLGEMGHFREVAKRYVGEKTWNELTPNRQGILTNMAYNMGEGTLGQFKNLRQAIQDGKWKQAQVEMQSSAWAGQVKGRADRLIARMGQNDSGARLGAAGSMQMAMATPTGMGGGGGTNINQNNNVSKSFTGGANPDDKSVVENHVT